MKGWRSWGLLLLLIPGLLANAAPLKLVGDFWPPYTDESLPGNGLAVDLVSTALERAGYATSYREAPWERALRGLQHGEYDVVVSAWYSDERAVFGDFSQPYLFNRIGLVKRKTNLIEFETLADLYPYRIAIRRGYAYSKEFDNDPQLQRVAFSNIDSAMRMLERGRVDLVVADEFVARMQFRRDLKDIADELDFLPTALSVNGLHILVSRTRPDHAELIERFDAAMASMRVDGSYQAIMERHGF